MTEYATERQRKWFASVREGMERDTGKSFYAWVEIARSCPETKSGARVKWLKEHHGLGVNRASSVLDVAFPETGLGWEQPEALRATLWSGAALTVLEAVEQGMAALDGVLVTQRKTYTAFSRSVQFAAMRPVRDGTALLGLKVEPDGARLTPRRSEAWSERLTATVKLATADEVDAEVEAAIRRAHAAG